MGSFVSFNPYSPSNINLNDVSRGQKFSSETTITGLNIHDLEPTLMNDGLLNCAFFCSFDFFFDALFGALETTALHRAEVFL